MAVAAEQAGLAAGLELLARCQVLPVQQGWIKKSAHQARIEIIRAELGQRLIDPGTQTRDRLRHGFAPSGAQDDRAQSAHRSTHQRWPAPVGAGPMPVQLRFACEDTGEEYV